MRSIPSITVFFERLTKRKRKESKKANWGDREGRQKSEQSAQIVRDDIEIRGNTKTGEEDFSFYSKHHRYVTLQFQINVSKGERE